MEDKIVFISVILIYIWYTFFYVKIRTKKYLKKSRKILTPWIIFKNKAFWDGVVSAFLSLLLYGSSITLNDIYSFNLSIVIIIFLVLLIMFMIIASSVIYHLLNYRNYTKINSE